MTLKYFDFSLIMVWFGVWMYVVQKSVRVECDGVGGWCEGCESLFFNSGCLYQWESRDSSATRIFF